MKLIETRETKGKVFGLFEMFPGDKLRLVWEPEGHDRVMSKTYSQTKGNFYVYTNVEDKVKDSLIEIRANNVLHVNTVPDAELFRTYLTKPLTVFSREDYATSFCFGEGGEPIEYRLHRLTDMTDLVDLIDGQELVYETNG